VTRTRHLPRLILVATALAVVAVDRPFLGGAINGPAREHKARGEREAGPYPSDWFGMQRAFPFATIPQKKLAIALEETRLARVERSLSAAAIPLTWTQAGPFNIGGRVTAIAGVPGASTVYLGAANGGVFRSTNGGTNWTPVFDDWGIYSIGALAVSPADPNVVYVGTGESNSSVDSYDGAGVFRSADGGVSWQWLGLQATARIGRVAIDPLAPDRVFVAAMGRQFSTGPDRGLYRSENGGLDWTRVLFVNDSTGVTDVAINPAHPETVFCATWERVRRPSYRRAYGPGCGIWRSIDHGDTWTRLSTGLPPPSDNVGRIGLAIAPSRPSVIYAQITTGVSAGYQGLGFYRSVDGGATWARRDFGSTYTGNFGGFSWYFGECRVDPANPDRVYSLGLSPTRSDDGGATFTGLGGVHVDQHALWIDPLDPTRLLLGNDGGFFRSTSPTPSFTKSLDLPISQFYAGAIDPSNPSRLLGGTQDNSTLITGGSPTAWTTILGGDGFQCLVDPTNPAVLFAEYQFGSYGSGPQRSTNSGGNFVSPSGINAGDRFNWSMPIVMDPTNHLVLLCASERVYRSEDNGITYAPISGDLSTNPVSELVYGTVTTLDVSPLDPMIYFAGTDDGRVWRTTNRGASWTEITAGLPLRWVTRVVADPLDVHGVYVTLSGFGMDERLAHVYRSGDLGDSWTSIAGNLPDAPANDLVPDPADSMTLYLATDVGVWVTRDRGGRWYPLGNGMPVQAVFDLTLHAASRSLVAATHGRSQWRLDLTQAPLAVTPSPPAVIALTAPAPNPSAGEAQLSLELSRASSVDVSVYDASGRLVRVLERDLLSSGRHALRWDGRDARGSRCAPGVFFVRAVASGSTAVRRLIRAE
jgi:photosystem II stability/assembly factor-like uncharacterized protein